MVNILCWTVVFGHYALNQRTFEGIVLDVGYTCLTGSVFFFSDSSGQSRYLLGLRALYWTASESSSLMCGELCANHESSDSQRIYIPITSVKRFFH